MSAHEQPERVLSTGVKLWDGRPDRLLTNTDVLVEDNRIVRVGGRLKAGGATVIDGGGRTLMPGLIDMHSHRAFQGGPL